jgi:type I restriction enzyme, S subunit
MSFPRYPKYKDSGVEWLGQVPQHWQMLPCRAIVRERSAKNDGAKCQDYLSLMANVGIIPYAEKGDVGNKKPEDLTKCKIVTCGDFVINSMNYGIGSYGLSEYDGVCSPVYIVLKPQNDVVESRFAFRIFENKAFQTFAQSFGNGILEHRCSINWDILKPIGVGVPPKDEQQAILEFLDQETAKIDELVAEQQRLMELLKEKRQSVISHAVTKGLNPKAVMKPSGVEWFGDVPSHWKVVALKHLVSRSIIDGPHESPECCDAGIPFVSAESVSKGFIDFDKIWGYISPKDHACYSKRYSPKRGDILMVKLGATTGVSAIVETEKEFNIWVPLAAIRLKPDIEPRFILHVLRSDNLHRAYENTWTYGTQQTLGLQTISNLRVPLPPREEREEIAKYIDSIVPAFESLIAEAQRGIDLLQERRTALISAAVTGQIDVRKETT